MSKATKTFDSLKFIMAYEGSDISDEYMIEGFQELINSGLVWQLQGSYGRMAHRLIQSGLCRKFIPRSARKRYDYKKSFIAVT